MKRRALPLALLLMALRPGVAPGEIVDRIVATVGKRVITLSEVAEAYRFERLLDQKPLQPLDPARIREVALRLIDQALLEQEMASSRITGVSRSEVERQMAAVRKSFEKNGDFHLVLQQYSLDEPRVFRRLELHANLERFIEAHFRPGVQVDERAIERYYRETLLPELGSKGVLEIPALEKVRDQIERILVEQRISSESSRWLRDLREQAQIRFR